MMTRNRRGAAQLFEFGSALYLFFFAFGIPIIALLNMIFTLSVAQFVTNEAADIAATASAFDIALSKSSERFLALSQSGIGKLAHLRSIDGYDDSGLDLFIEIKDLRSQKVDRFGPNVALKQELQLDKKTYSYRVISKFAIGPVFSTASNALLPIPYMTVPVATTFSAVRVVERPDTLSICVQD